MKVEPIVSFLLMLIIISTVVYAQTTRDDAVKAIGQAKEDISEMMGAGFSVKYVNDTLASANQALERADFAELIRQNATGDLAQQAKKALEGLNYEGFTYDDVLTYTQQISSRKQEAYNISDSIRALEIKIGEYNQSINTSDIENTLKDIKIDFENERYSEVETLLSKANSDLENKESELTAVNIIARSSKNFVENNWPEILIASVVIGISGWLGWRRHRIKRIHDNLKKLRIEKESLLKLMKKTQVERFEKGKLSESIYKIRMGKYSERLNEIKETTPVLEAILRKNKKKTSGKIHKDKLSLKITHTVKKLLKKLKKI